MNLKRHIIIFDNYFMFLDSNLMDEYLLGRLFKYTDSKNALIFAGKYHINRMLII